MAELKIEELKAGTGTEAAAGKTVDVHYTGWLTTGQKFDSSVDRGKPFSFKLGAGQVIKGWDQGVAGMKVGGKRKLTIPPALAYGDRGFPGATCPARRWPRGRAARREVTLFAIKEEAAMALCSQTHQHQDSGRARDHRRHRRRLVLHQHVVDRDHQRERGGDQLQVARSVRRRGGRRRRAAHLTSFASRRPSAIRGRQALFGMVLLVAGGAQIAHGFRTFSRDTTTTTATSTAPPITTRTVEETPAPVLRSSPSPTRPSQGKERRSRQRPENARDYSTAQRAFLRGCDPGRGRACSEVGFLRETGREGSEPTLRPPRPSRQRL